MNILLDLMAGILGVIIGYGFGYLQSAAQKRNEKRERSGKFTAWVMIPGSMARIVYLMVALVVIQVVCPMLFDGEMQWIVSAGVVIGYGIMLYKQLIEKIFPNPKSLV